MIFPCVPYLFSKDSLDNITGEFDLVFMLSVRMNKSTSSSKTKKLKFSVICRNFHLQVTEMAVPPNFLYSMFCQKLSTVSKDKHTITYLILDGLLAFFHIAILEFNKINSVTSFPYCINRCRTFICQIKISRI